MSPGLAVTVSILQTIAPGWIGVVVPVVVVVVVVCRHPGRFLSGICRFCRCLFVVYFKGVVSFFFLLKF